MRMRSIWVVPRGKSASSLCGRGFFFSEKKEDTDHMDMQEQLRKIQEEAAHQLENVRDKAG